MDMLTKRCVQSYDFKNNLATEILLNKIEISLTNIYWTLAGFIIHCVFVPGIMAYSLQPIQYATGMQVQYLNIASLYTNCLLFPIEFEKDWKAIPK